MIWNCLGENLTVQIDQHYFMMKDTDSCSHVNQIWPGAQKETEPLKKNHSNHLLSFKNIVTAK